MAGGAVRTRGLVDVPVAFPLAFGLREVAPLAFAAPLDFLVLEVFDVVDDFEPDSFELILDMLLVRFVGGGMFSTSASVVAVRFLNDARTAGISFKLTRR